MDLDATAFDQDRLLEYVLTRPWDVLVRLVSSLSIAASIWWNWSRLSADESAGSSEEGGVYQASSLRRARDTPRGEALRSGLVDMGVFFVKVGQTAAQRPDIVGDDVAEELKGLQERSRPFSDEEALRIIAEDLGHPGPLAPGVLWEGCQDPDGKPLLQELNPKHVASASLGQVYRGRMHDGREVALKVQRPGVRDVLGLDWAVAVIVVTAYQKLIGSPNDYAAVVDTVARGVRMELDYYNEMANCEEFAVRHAFLPFVSSPGCIPELMAPPGRARVLAMQWYPSRAPEELSIEERRRLVEMAVEACVVQLLVTGFVHADPHEGNLRLGDDGRVVFLDFGLMDRVDFGIMENCAAGVRHVLNKDWVELSKVFQEVRFAPKPMLRNTAYGITRRPRYEPCSVEEFAEVVGRQIEREAGGQSRFGAMATALKKLSDRYLMLTPPFVALLCRTFITLEGLLSDDPELAESYNVYRVALPFAIRRVLSPRTRKGRSALRRALLKGCGEPSQADASATSSSSSASQRSSRRHCAVPNWPAIAELLSAGSSEDASATASAVGDSDGVGGRSCGAEAGVQRRLLRTAEGAALRELLCDVDLFEALRGFLVGREARAVRILAVQALADLWSRPRRRLSSGPAVGPWGPRCLAASRGWGSWREDDPYVLPPSTIEHSRTAWKIVLRRQLSLCLWPPWRPPLRLSLLLFQVLPSLCLFALRGARAAVRERALQRRSLH